jgi:hypothetical protein
LFDPSADHVAFNTDGLIMSRTAAVKYNPESSTTAFYTWQPDKPRLLKPSAATAEHQRLLQRFKAAVAVTDYILKHPEKEKQP